MTHWPYGSSDGLPTDLRNFSRNVLKLKKTKSSKRREVPIRDIVYQILSARPEPRRGLVWPDGYNPTAFEIAVEEAKLDAPFTWHDCRHHFASWFMMRGGGLLDLKIVGGWGFLKMVERYAHLSPSHLRDSMSKTERAALEPALGTKAGTKTGGADRTTRKW